MSRVAINAIRYVTFSLTYSSTRPRCSVPSTIRRRLQTKTFYRHLPKMATPQKTYLAFQYDGSLTTLDTKIISNLPALSLDEPNRAVFKGIDLTPESAILITESTIFHPQGGGQPSDTGTMTDPTTNTTFNVTAVRTGAIGSAHSGQVLHLGTFTDPSSSSANFTPGTTLTQTIDQTKRDLYSRYHTAGHVLGSAIRHLLSPSIPDFDELKANHFPSSASCEFRGLIDGKHKPAIQQRVDEYIAKDMPVEIDFWTEEDFRANGLERLIPDREAMGLGADEKFRVVKIVGAEVYPCGGTHVGSTRGVEGTVVRKIARQKGVSKVSYAVE